MIDVSLIISLLSISTVVVVSVWIILEKRRPSSTLAWILALVFLPYIGLLMYLVLGRRRLRHTRRSIRQRKAFRGTLPGAASALEPREHALIQMAARFADEPVTAGNRVRILKDATEAYPALFDAIGHARAYILVEYYIVQVDSAGERLRHALIEAARRGVRVYFLFDSVGSWNIDDGWLAPMREAGCECCAFLPLHLTPIRLRWNFRNHRKLVVVDGRVGLTGGINIGEEYEGKNPDFGHWRDMHLEVHGPAVRSLERIFHDDWHLATGQVIERAGHFPDLLAEGSMGRDLVQVLPSGPDREWETIHLQMFVAISTARTRCYVTTPYFVPDEPIRVALITAAMRGVDVRLLLPCKSDLPFVRYAGRSYVEELLRAGVRIFEYDAGVLHAKTMVVDTSYGTVGSANMDIRSFRLNFEVNVFVYGREFAERLERVFEEDCAVSTELELESFLRRPRREKVIESFARVCSPLL